MRKPGYGLGALLLAMLILGGCGSSDAQGDKSDALSPVQMDFGTRDEDGAGKDMPSAADGTSGNGTVGAQGGNAVPDAGGALGITGGVPGSVDSIEMYGEVLRGKREFVDESGGRLKLDQVREAVTPDTDISIEPGSFAVVDMDKDGEPEVVLSLILNGGVDYGSLVLHNWGGVVYGYIFAQRELNGIKANGSFSASGGAADVGICRLSFDGAAVRVDQSTYSQSGYDGQNNLLISYYVDNRKTGKEEYDRAYREWEALPDVEWHKLTEENIADISLFWEGTGTVSSPDSTGALKGQILDQSFTLSLDGWGNVTFAPFAPRRRHVWIPRDGLLMRMYASNS